MGKATIRPDLPPEAVDKIYAESLFQLAEKEGGRERVEAVAGELDELADMGVENPDIGEFLQSLIVSAKDKERVLKIALHGRVSPTVLNFMLTLNRRDRINRFRPIATAFQEIYQERFGKVEVDVYTPQPMAPGQLEKLGESVRAVLHREPILHAYIDDKMLGGLKVQVGDKLIDASIDAQLRKMRERLTEQGGGALRERIDRMFGE